MPGCLGPHKGSPQLHLQLSAGCWWFQRLWWGTVQRPDGGLYVPSIRFIALSTEQGRWLHPQNSPKSSVGSGVMNSTVGQSIKPTFWLPSGPGLCCAASSCGTGCRALRLKTSWFCDWVYSRKVPCSQGKFGCSTIEIEVVSNRFFTSTSDLEWYSRGVEATIQSIFSVSTLGCCSHMATKPDGDRDRSTLLGPWLGDEDP